MGKPISKAHFITLLSRGLTDFYGRKISFSEVQDQLFLIESGIEPTDPVIASWIRIYSSNGTD